MSAFIDLIMSSYVDGMQLWTAVDIFHRNEQSQVEKSPRGEINILLGLRILLGHVNVS